MNRPIILEIGPHDEFWDVCKELEGAPSGQMILNILPGASLHHPYEWSLIYRCAYIMKKHVSIICTDTKISNLAQNAGFPIFPSWDLFVSKTSFDKSITGFSISDLSTYGRALRIFRSIPEHIIFDTLERLKRKEKQISFEDLAQVLETRFYKKSSLPQKTESKNSSSYSIFFCYAHEDEFLLDQLKMHLMSLQRKNLISTWHDRNISPGMEWEKEIHKHIDISDIILLLISPSFMASEYCFSIELKKAMERHEKGEVKVIPIILRPVHWEYTPFRKIQALPTDGKPIICWHSLDEAFLDVVNGIIKAISDIGNSEIE